jgi:hypothetical protein
MKKNFYFCILKRGVGTGLDPYPLVRGTDPFADPDPVPHQNVTDSQQPYNSETAKKVTSPEIFIVAHPSRQLVKVMHPPVFLDLLYDAARNLGGTLRHRHRRLRHGARLVDGRVRHVAGFAGGPLDDVRPAFRRSGDKRKLSTSRGTVPIV